MFRRNLSIMVLKLCDQHNISYEEASLRCDLSPRYFGSIVRGKAKPSIITIEKICCGFNITPDELLLNQADANVLAPLPVTMSVKYSFSKYATEYPLCPKCNIVIKRDFQLYCDRCGQKLD